MTVLSGLYDSKEVASAARSVYNTVSSKMPSDSLAILAMSPTIKCEAWNVDITVLSPIVICLAKCSFHNAFSSVSLRSTHSYCFSVPGYRWLKSLEPAD
jgi:hypothetical protein